MDHFVDIDLRPDPEVAPHQLMGALYSKLHRALAAQQSDAIGVSFPQHKAAAPTLGTRLRLHGTSSALTGLLGTPWLTSLRDQVSLGRVLPVPPGCAHCSVRRVQTKSSPERLRRRLQRRHGLTEAQAAERIPASVARELALPFVTLTSASTGQRFPLFLAHGAPQAAAVPGPFNAYGISTSATLPWF